MRRDDICLYLGPADRSELRALISNRNTPRKLVWRAEIVLATADARAEQPFEPGEAVGVDGAGIPREMIDRVIALPTDAELVPDAGRSRPGTRGAHRAQGKGIPHGDDTGVGGCGWLPVARASQILDNTNQLN